MIFVCALVFLNCINCNTEEKLVTTQGKEKMSTKQQKNFFPRSRTEYLNNTKKNVATTFLCASTQVGKPMPRNRLTMNPKHRQKKTDQAEDTYSVPRKGDIKQKK
jgi:hypothetical protein